MSAPKAPLIIYGYAFTVVSSITLMSVAIGTPHWVRLHISSTAHVDFGLFKACLNNKCIDYDNDKLRELDLSRITASVGLCISSVVLNVLTMGTMLHLVCVQKMLVQTKNHGWVTLTLTIIAAILAWAGAGNIASLDFDSNSSDVSDSTTNGYSLYLASASGIVSIVAGVFAVLSVNYLVNSQVPQNIVFQQHGSQIVPGVQVVTSSSPPYAYPPTMPQHQQYFGGQLVHQQQPPMMMAAAPFPGYVTDQPTVAFQKQPPPY